MQTNVIHQKHQLRLKQEMQKTQSGCNFFIPISLHWQFSDSFITPCFQAHFIETRKITITPRMTLWWNCLKNFMVWYEPHDKTNKVSVHPAKIQISLGICSVWSDASLCTQWVAKDQSFLHADSKDSDQTEQMPRLIWVCAGCILALLVLSRGGSYFIENHATEASCNHLSHKNHYKLLLPLMHIHVCIRRCF